MKEEQLEDFKRISSQILDITFERPILKHSIEFGIDKAPVMTIEWANVTYKEMKG